MLVLSVAPSQCRSVLVRRALPIVVIAAQLGCASTGDRPSNSGEDMVSSTAAAGGLGGLQAGIIQSIWCGPLMGVCLPVLAVGGAVIGTVGGAVVGSIRQARRERGELPGACHPGTGHYSYDSSAQAASLLDEFAGRELVARADRRARPAPSTPVANGNLPSVDTMWTYKLDDRIYGGGGTEVVMRVAGVTDTGIQELVTSETGSSERVVRIGDLKILQLPLGGSALLVEISPYLVASGDEGALLGSPSITGYPHGQTGLSPWRIRVTKWGWEQVSVSAGSYCALRIQIDGEREQQVFAWGQDGEFSIIAWYAPEVKRLVRLEHKTWEPFSHKLNEHKVLELVSFRPPS